MARSYDLVIRGGRLVDGTGAPGRTADVAIRGDTIADVGAIMPTDETPLLEASGLTVTPGFIDAWGAADPLAPVFTNPETKLLQGITTDVAGAGAHSPFPLAEGDGLPAGDEDLIVPDWTDAKGFLLRIARAGTGIHRAFFADYGRIREAVVGPSDAALTRDEQRHVARELASALEAGCLGLGVDLASPPSAYAKTEEIVELGRALAGAGAVLALGLRDSGAELESAVEESLEIATRTGVELLLPGLRIGPKPFWGKIAWLEERLARAIEDGVGLFATVEPYVARRVALSSLLSPGDREGGAEGIARRLASSAGREEILRTLDGRAAGDDDYWSRITLAPRDGEDAERRAEEGTRSGRTLAVEATERKRAPSELFLDILAEEPDREALAFETNEGNIERMLGWDFVAVGSGSAARPVRDERAPPPLHPADRGAFARILRRYVREKQMLTLEEAVRRMTSLPADRLRLGRRGRIIAGYAADVAIFRASAVTDRSTYADPRPTAHGIDQVIVNGRFAVRNGEPTGVRAGTVTRRG